VLNADGLLPAARSTPSWLAQEGASPYPRRSSWWCAVPRHRRAGHAQQFANGNKLVVMYKWNPERALELIEREHVTTFVGVPTMSWDLLESPDFASRDTSSLVSVGGGGPAHRAGQAHRLQLLEGPPVHRLRH
jgi:acyl-coenzyme A synthetase/AMP-(fatty) acid ligase